VTGVQTCALPIYPTEVTVRRLGWEDGKITHKETTRTWEKSEAENLTKTGWSQLTSGLNYMAGMLVNFRFGGGQRAVPVDEMMRHALGAVERSGEDIHAGGWAGVETSTAQKRGLVGGAVDVVRQYPVQTVSAFMMAGNVTTTLAGWQKMQTNKSGRVNKILQEERQKLLQDPQVRAGFEAQVESRFNITGEADKRALVDQLIDVRVKEIAEKNRAPELKKARDFDFWEDAVKNYQGWGGLLSVATDAVNVAVPQATPEELAEMKASGHPIKSNPMYQWLAKDPMVVNKIAVPEKIASGFFGYQSGDTWFEQVTVVARNAMFAGYRFLMSLGKKGAQAEEGIAHLKPLIAASANMALQAPDEVTRNVHISKMAAAHVDYMVENGMMNLPDDEKKQQAMRHEMGVNIKKAILDKTQALQTNPWLNVRQPEQGLSQGRALAPTSGLEQTQGWDRSTTSSVRREAEQSSAQAPTTTTTEQPLVDSARQQPELAGVRQPS